MTWQAYMGKNKNLIGADVKKLRAERWMTKEVFLQQLKEYGLDINIKSLSRLEEQRRRVLDYEIVAIANAFNIEPNELLDFETNSKKGLSLYMSLLVYMLIERECRHVRDYEVIALAKGLETDPNKLLCGDKYEGIPLPLD